MEGLVIIDTSALIAILLEEPEMDDFLNKIANDPKRWISSFSFLESGIVIESRKNEIGGRELDLFIHRSKIDIIPFNPEQAEIARQAWRKYGKGNHPARLNMGDCCTYALAKYSGEPLLFKGNDFGQTDLLLCS